jgi:hypothetical protein
MRLPLGLWIWLKLILAADLVAEKTWIGMETRASLIWPCHYARAGILSLVRYKRERKPSRQGSECPGQ